MAEERLLTIRDVALLLGVSEKEIMDLAESGSLPAYKIAGIYLRFKRTQVEEFKKTFTGSPHESHAPKKSSLGDELSDFFYFNDFYILSALLILLVLVLIFR